MRRLSKFLKYSSLGVLYFYTYFNHLNVLYGYLLVTLGFYLHQLEVINLEKKILSDKKKERSNLTFDFSKQEEPRYPFYDLLIAFIL